MPDENEKEPKARRERTTEEMLREALRKSAETVVRPDILNSKPSNLSPLEPPAQSGDKDKKD